MTELVRVPSKGFYKLLDQIAENEKTTRDYFEEALTLARREKFTDLEIALLMKDYLKDKIPKATLWRWTKALEPKEDTEIEESTSQSVSMKPNVGNNDTEKPNYLEPDPDEPYGLNSQQEEIEEPTELELLKIENEQLKDAIHKVQHFQPASKMEGQVETFPPIQEEEMVEFLRKRDNKVSCFFYDAYGIDAFKNRELSQLKNSGVKTFKRLYFEV